MERSGHQNPQAVSGSTSYPIYPPSYVLPRSCNESCTNLVKAAQKAQEIAATHPGKQIVVICSKHRRRNCVVEIFIEGTWSTSHANGELKLIPHPRVYVQMTLFAVNAKRATVAEKIAAVMCQNGARYSKLPPA